MYHPNSFKEDLLNRDILNSSSKDILNNFNLNQARIPFQISNDYFIPGWTQTLTYIPLTLEVEEYTANMYIYIKTTVQI